MTDRVYNFYPGPATLPLSALKKAKEELLNWNGTGMSVMEISHRSKEWDNALNEANLLLRKLMDISDDYTILWMGGGASTQFYQVPLNLGLEGRPMEYVNTGRWSTKAIAEAVRFGEVRTVASSEDDDFKYIPKDVSFSDGAAFAHITGNNTIYGTEWHEWPDTDGDVPLVSDMSSNLMDRVTDVKKFGAIYAGAQKNLGPAGVTLLIVREDLLGRVPDDTPSMQKWITYHKKNSMFNTPPVFNIYMCKLSMEHLDEIGGVKAQEKKNRKKAELLYDVIDSSDGFYEGWARKEDRSLMNVSFRLPSEELEQKCVEEGAKRGLIGLKGHRSVGGMRASIYNAMSIEGVETLTKFLTEFKEKHE
ncbi:3-phosphoserine/phosphohydroxythreonine transaminase [Candidatus Thorarchaeota archaeon]|nr:MAG: 3-phosphoserine/phosphohydroxythreonine transaminase [Candidatus Thorarchaeota archaeon]